MTTKNMSTKYSTLPILAVALTLLLAGCNKFLGIEPKGFLIPDEVEDYDAILNNENLLKTSEYYLLTVTDDVHLEDQDQLGIYTASLDAVEAHWRKLYTFQPEVFSSSQRDDLWEGSYERIYYYNTVIHGVEAVGHNRPEEQIIIAEAKVGRAMEYLTLVGVYAKAYNPESAPSEPALPLLTSDVPPEGELTRATLEEVCQQIEADLQYGVQHLADKPRKNAYHPSRNSALALLARFYLYKGAYKEAGEAAAKALTIESQLLDLKPYSVVDPFAFNGRIDVPDELRNPENILMRRAPYIYGCSEMYYLSEELLALYPEGDKRKELYMSADYYGIPLERHLWKPCLIANFGISTPEVYLTLAEAEARVGSTEKALQLIHTLQSHRMPAPQSWSGLSKEKALKVVLEERRRELAFIGVLRYIDLKRLNQDPQWAKSIHRTVEGKELTLEPNNPLYQQPIPPKVLRFNPNMKDNPRS